MNRSGLLIYMSLMLLFLSITTLSAQEINELKTFNLTIDTYQPQELILNHGRLIWKDQDYGNGLYNLKYFNGQEIVLLDSGLSELTADLDGDYVVWNSAAQEVKLYNLRDWTVTNLGNSYNPDGKQQVAVANGQVVYARSNSSGTDIVLYEINSAQETIHNAGLWNTQPDIHHGQIAWVVSDTAGSSALSDIFFYDGNTTRNITNSSSAANRNPLLEDGQIAWMEEDSGTTRVRLFTGDTTITLAEPANSTTIIQGYDISDGVAVAGLTDTLVNSSQIIIHESESQSTTNILLQDSIATPHVDNRLVMWVEGRRFQGQIKVYYLDAQIFDVFGSAVHAVIDDEEYAWTFGESVELGRPVTYEKMTDDAQNGWEQSRFKPIDDGNLVWGNYQNSTKMRLFYNDGNTTTQLTDSSAYKDFVMQNDGYTIWRHETDFLWLYDGVNPPVQVVDSIQLENPYIAGGSIGFFGFYLDDPNLIRYPFLYDIQSGTLNQLRQNDVDPKTVLCDGNTAVWQEGFLGDLYYYDGNTITVLSDSAVGSDYSYRNGIIVWCESKNGVFQIMMHDVTTGNTTQITNSGAHQVKPATDGNVIVWFENQNFPLSPVDSLIWYYDIQQNSYTKPGRGYPSSFETPWVSNGKIGWSVNGRVFVYDGQSITMLTSEFLYADKVTVDDEWLVWRRTPNPNFQDNGDIFRNKLQPRVAFDAANISGEAPLTVTFSNRSWQGNQTYHWDFGDNQTSQQKNTSHTYQNPGVYSVTLTVTGPGGSVTEKKVNLVRVKGTSDISFINGNAPRTFELRQNFPNPFNPSTIIRFSLASPALVDLEIFNLLGQRVKRLVGSGKDHSLKAGWHEIQWNGTNDSGQPVASGVYLYRLQINPRVKGEKRILKTRKMILMR